MKDSSEIFEEDRAMEVIRRAIEIDTMDSAGITKDDIRHIAAQIDIKPSSLDRAFREAGSELVARPPAPASATRRWIPFGLVVAAGTALVVAAPGSFKDPSIVLPYLFAVAASYFAAANRMHELRSAMRIGEEGIAYHGRKGRKVLKWSSVIAIEPFLPETIKVVGPSNTLTVPLRDFGDPDAVLTIIKSRIKAANGS
jgi:hypothetical protein